MNDWFEKITGFRELPYEETQAKLRIEAGRLHSAATDRHFAVGVLEVRHWLSSAAESARSRARVAEPGSAASKAMHADSTVIP